jgi:hypothetical protein
MTHATAGGPAGVRLSPRDRLHVAGRALMALALGWGYLAAALWFDFGGLRSFAAVSPVGAVAVTQLWGVVGVAFAVTGAHIGWSNVADPRAVRAIRAEAAARRGAARHMGLRP